MGGGVFALPDHLYHGLLDAAVFVLVSGLFDKKTIVVVVIFIARSLPFSYSRLASTW